MIGKKNHLEFSADFLLLSKSQITAAFGQRRSLKALTHYFPFYRISKKKIYRLEPLATFYTEAETYTAQN